MYFHKKLLKKFCSRCFLSRKSFYQIVRSASFSRSGWPGFSLANFYGVGLCLYFVNVTKFFPFVINTRGSQVKSRVKPWFQCCPGLGDPFTSIDIDYQTETKQIAVEVLNVCFDIYTTPYIICVINEWNTVQ